MADTTITQTPITEKVQQFYEARDHLRRGICLLNAKRFDRAVHHFTLAMRLNPESKGLGQYLVRCHVGRQDLSAAADAAAQDVRKDADDITSRIRHALLLYKNGDGMNAIASLRQGIQQVPDCGELHFQLGTLLAAAGDEDEAELRFTQTLMIDRRHVEAMVGLAMCYGVKEEVRSAYKLLIRAQAIRPHDARIGHLLSIASRGLGMQGGRVDVNAVMPEDIDTAGVADVDEISRMVLTDPEFVDAFIDLRGDEISDEVYALLRRALRQALRAHPERADLHLRHGQIAERIGQADEAINAVEKALTIEPKCVRGLIQLARLYQQTDRHANAAERLEQALALGVKYADVYFLLGQSYRVTGQVKQAREAFNQAIRINGRYADAREALAAIAV